MCSGGFTLGPSLRVNDRVQVGRSQIRSTALGRCWDSPALRDCTRRSGILACLDCVFCLKLSILRHGRF